MFDVIIYYEVIQREYENALLIKYELERRGYSVKIINTINSDYYKSYFCRCKVAVIHTIRKNINVSYYTRCIFGKPKALVNMQYEQVFSKRINDSNAVIPKGKAKNAYHICWGDDAVKRLRNVNVDENKIWAIGPIQFDILRPEFRKYFKEKEDLANEFGFSSTNRLILFNGNFPYANYSLEEIRQLDSKTYFGNKEERWKDRFNAQREIASWIDDFLENHTDITFVYRPHPSEKISDVILQLNQKYENFHVIRKYSVRQWIIVADIVNVWESTSIVEAIYAKKKCNVCYPFDISMEDRCFIFENSQVIKTSEEFESNNKTYDFQNPLDIDILKRYYAFDLEKPVYYELCNRIEHLIKSDNREDYYVKPNFTYIGHELKFAIRTFYFDILNSLRKTFKINCNNKRFNNMYLASFYDEEILYETYSKKLMEVLKEIERKENEGKEDYN